MNERLALDAGPEALVLYSKVAGEFVGGRHVARPQAFYTPLFQNCPSSTQSNFSLKSLLIPKISPSTLSQITITNHWCDT